MNYGHCWITAEFYGLDDVNNILFAIIPFLSVLLASCGTQLKTLHFGCYAGVCARTFLPVANNDSLKSCTNTVSHIAQFILTFRS